MSVVAASVTLTPATTVAEGAAITATYDGLQSGTPVWLCFETAEDTVVAAPPACGAAGDATAITTGGSGAAVVCTASTTGVSTVALTWTDVTENNLRVRACTSDGDLSQTDNANQVFHERKFSSSCVLRCITSESSELSSPYRRI